MADSSLVTLLVKLGVVASLASILVRWSAVKRMLMRENRTVSQRMKLSLWFSIVFGASVATRVLERQSYSSASIWAWKAACSRVCWADTSPAWYPEF